MSIFSDKAELNRLRYRIESLERELQLTEQSRASYISECEELRRENREQEEELGKLRRTLDDICARLFDALGCTEYGRCLHEFAERRMQESGMSFTQPAN